MHRGYVKLWRKSLDNGLLQNSEAWALWCHILMSVTHKPRKQLVGNSTIDLEPGQMITGRKALAATLKLSEQIIRTRLSLLEKLGNLTIKPTSKFSIISVVNWEAYQINEEGTNQQVNQQATNKQPAFNQQATTNKNRRTGEEERIRKEQDTGAHVHTRAVVPPDEKSPPPPTLPGPKKLDSPSKSRPSRTGFASCYQAYPVQQGEEEAWREWCRLEDNGTLTDPFVIRDHIVLMSQEDDNWQAGYAPRFAKYLSGKRWNDKPSQKISVSRSNQTVSPAYNLREEKARILNEEHRREEQCKSNAVQAIGK